MQRIANVILAVTAAVSVSTSVVRAENREGTLSAAINKRLRAPVIEGDRQSSSELAQSSGLQRDAVPGRSMRVPFIDWTQKDSQKASPGESTKLLRGVSASESVQSSILWQAGDVELVRAPNSQIHLRGTDGPCQAPLENCQIPGITDAYTSDLVNLRVADNFVPAVGGTLSTICWNGVYNTSNPPPDSFAIRYYLDNDGVPGTLLATFTQTGGTLIVIDRRQTGAIVAGFAPEYEYSASHGPVSVSAGTCYWIEITNTMGGASVWFWERASDGDGRAMQDGTTSNGYDLRDTIEDDLAFCLNVPLDIVSCLPNTICSHPEERCQASDTSDALRSDQTTFLTADNFSTSVSGVVTDICWRGTYLTDPPPTDSFRIRYYSNADGLPGSVLATFSQIEGTLILHQRSLTGALIAGSVFEYEYAASHAALPVSAGDCYWIEISNATGGTAWFWGKAVGDGMGIQDGNPLDGFGLDDLRADDLAFCLNLPLSVSGSCAPELICEQPADHCQARGPQGSGSGTLLFSNGSSFITADDFSPAVTGVLNEICWWGAYSSDVLPEIGRASCRERV